jgi:hypothetical protein
MIQMYHLPEGPGIELGQERKKLEKKFVSQILKQVSLFHYL